MKYILWFFKLLLLICGGYKASVSRCLICLHDKTKEYEKRKYIMFRKRRRRPKRFIPIGQRRKRLET